MEVLEELFSLTRLLFVQVQMPRKRFLGDMPRNKEVPEKQAPEI
jgi:hypothetical protein